LSRYKYLARKTFLAARTGALQTEPATDSQTGQQEKLQAAGRQTEGQACRKACTDRQPGRQADNKQTETDRQTEIC